MQKMLSKRSKNDQAEKTRKCLDKGSELKGEFKKFCEKKEVFYIQPKTKPSRHLLRGIFDRSKT